MKHDYDDEKIEQMRKAMIQSGLQYGLENEKTIQLSIQLDALMNSFIYRDYERDINKRSHLFYKN